MLEEKKPQTRNELLATEWKRVKEKQRKQQQQQNTHQNPSHSFICKTKHTGGLTKETGYKKQIKYTNPIEKYYYYLPSLSSCLHEQIKWITKWILFLTPVKSLAFN